MIGASTGFVKYCPPTPVVLEKPTYTEVTLKHKRREASNGILTIPAGQHKVVVRNIGPMVNDVLAKIDVEHGVDSFQLDIDGQHTFETLYIDSECIKAPLQEINITTNDSTVWADCYWYE